MCFKDTHTLKCLDWNNETKAGNRFVNYIYLKWSLQMVRKSRWKFSSQTSSPVFNSSKWNLLHTPHEELMCITYCQEAFPGGSRVMPLFQNSFISLYNFYSKFVSQFFFSSHLNDFLLVIFIRTLNCNSSIVKQCFNNFLPKDINDVKGY